MKVENSFIVFADKLTPKVASLANNRGAVTVETQFVSNVARDDNNAPKTQVG
jgi:hypothetical protein